MSSSNWKHRAAAWGLVLAATTATAADHADAPSSTLDPSADITDVFVFRAADKLVGVIAFGGAPRPRARVDGPTGLFDPNALFTYHIDTNRDAVPDINVQIRFGKNGKDQWGVEIENLPGARSRYVLGPVERVNTSASGLRFYAGLRDDPFFFDFEGFVDTLSTFAADGPSGELRFDNQRDSFRFRNLTAIVFEMDLAAATKGSRDINVWATASRLVQP
ncbi:MAG TPA: DUF4331 family protein [Solimonas sp.]|nr:DUF4331 family protein [Solimonas sp.]